MQRVSSPSRRNCFSISLVVNLFCVFFFLFFSFCFACLISSILSASIYKRRHFLIFMFWREVSVAMLLNMFKRVERDVGIAPDFTQISRRRRLFHDPVA